MEKVEIEQIELNLLLEGIYRRYGYDFRQYSQASVRRRVYHHLAKTRLQTISELIAKILYDEALFQALDCDHGRHGIWQGIAELGPLVEFEVARL